jgi:hypothetical protein
MRPVGDANPVPPIAIFSDLDRIESGFLSGCIPYFRHVTDGDDLPNSGGPGPKS